MAEELPQHGGSPTLERTSSRVPIDHFDPQGFNKLKQTLSRFSSNGGDRLGRSTSERQQPNEGNINEESDTSEADSGFFDPADSKFDFEKTVRNIFAQAEDQSIQTRQVGCAFHKVNVIGEGSDILYGESVGSMFAKPLHIGQMIKEKRHPKVKPILHNFTGHIKPGRILLVLGRPGAGCSTFLKILANHRESFRGIEGEMTYGGFSSEDMTNNHKGEMAYLPEDDVHFPTLKVDETIDFATKTKAPKNRLQDSRAEYISFVKSMILTIVGLRRVADIKVGNDFVRGVSGGQRKRVGIAEMMAIRSKLNCWDNATRGLDSSTALEFIKALRILTDIAKSSTVLSLYQAGEQIYDLVDDVCVIHSGRMIYYGDARKAKDYFFGMGYEPMDRQTTPDFLVAVTNPLGRSPRKGYEDRAPKTASDMAQYWEQSEMGKTLEDETVEYLQSFTDDHRKDFKSSYRSEQSRHTKHKSPYTISLPMQVRACLLRQYQIQKGDFATTFFISAASIIQSLIIGSVFYQMPQNTSGFFSRGGVIFFGILFNAFTTMSEITNSYSQRPIVYRQKKFAMYHPGCDALSKIILDFPTKFITITPFCIILYFLSGLQATASQFFIFLLIIYISTLSMTVYFRMLASCNGSESVATMLAGLSILAIAIYTGYALPRTQMHNYFIWISYINPISYAFEALMANEFYNLNVPCTGLIPSGAGYETVAPMNQVCGTPGYVGGTTNTNTVLGESYIEASFGYTRGHLWRNLGFVIMFWIAFIVVHVLSYEYFEYGNDSRTVMLFKRGKAPKAAEEAMNSPDGKVDEESGPDGAPVAGRLEDDGSDEKKLAARPSQALQQQRDIFTWRNVSYTVPVKGGNRTLLSDVSGWVKPGTLTALMGESGAGKTTLLNVLAQRTDVGVVTGDMFVNAKPLPVSFQRQTGYCQQQDIHLETATVREALQFSAVLRQSASIPKSEKYAYVESVIQMLEMESWAEALVGEVGSGLNVEQRKRLTIGVELAAKPALLLFLDEPTSGLDSQSAWSIVSFCRRLADAGQAILCTIHQPSGELFQVFDRLLLLRKGGETVYFGDIGPSSRTLTEYYERNGARPCGSRENPAEYILDILGAGASSESDTDWYQTWCQSPEKTRCDEELADLHDQLRDKQAAVGNESDSQRNYAAGFFTQFNVVFGRLLQNYWRSPTYVASKLGLNIIAGLFICFTFFKSPRSPAGLQSYLFGIFMAIVLSTSLSQQLQPKFLAMRALYEVRERPSKMYNGVVLGLTNVLIEIPYNVVCGTVFFMCWYWGIGFPHEASRAGYSWAMLMVFEVYFASFAQAVAAIVPNAMVASVLFSTLFSFVLIFNGILQPPGQIPTFWRVWMYPLSPFTYLVEGLLGTALGNIPITCEDTDFQILNVVPNGQTCAEYLNPYFTANGGYVNNPMAPAGCQICQYSNGNQFLAPLQVSYDHRWQRDYPVMWAFTIFNLLLVSLGLWLRFGGLKHLSFGRKAKKTPGSGASPAQGPLTSAMAETQGEKTEPTSSVGGDGSLPGFGNTKQTTM